VRPSDDLLGYYSSQTFVREAGDFTFEQDGAILDANDNVAKDFFSGVSDGFEFAFDLDPDDTVSDSRLLDHRIAQMIAEFAVSHRRRRRDSQSVHDAFHAGHGNRGL
jgi:hypothetical protein